jgi:hypothetical protein
MIDQGDPIINEFSKVLADLQFISFWFADGAPGTQNGVVHFGVGYR